MAKDMEQYDLIDKNLLTNVKNSLFADEWTWDKDMAGELPVVFLNNDRTAVFHPNTSFGTLAVSGKRPLDSKTIAFWEIEVPSLFGTSMMFGVGKKTSTRSLDIIFTDLLCDILNEYFDESFGLAHTGKLYGGKFNGKRCILPRTYCKGLENRLTKIGLLFNGIEGWLSYFIDGKSMGVAFTDIDASNEPYFPMISSTSQRSEFTLRSQLICQTPKLLTEICLTKISSHKKKYLACINEINLPIDLRKRVLKKIYPKKPLKQVICESYIRRKHRTEIENNSINFDLQDLFNYEFLTRQMKPKRLRNMQD